MADLVLTNIYLEQRQKRAIVRRAKANGTNMSTEIRNAYLAGVSAAEIRLLDAATCQAKLEIDQMNAILDAGQARARKFFAEIEKIKSGTRK